MDTDESTWHQYWNKIDSSLSDVDIYALCSKINWITHKYPLYFQTHNPTITTSIINFHFIFIALYNELPRLKEFIKNDCTNVRDNSGYTALHYAARNGHLDACQLLIDGGANINAKTNGGVTPIHRAAMMGE